MAQVVLAVLAAVCVFATTLDAQQPAPAFEVASIKRNPDPRPPRIGTMRDTPKGEIRVVAVLARLPIKVVVNWHEELKRLVPTR